MSERSEKPLTWAERKSRIQRCRWKTPFQYAEWLCEWVAYGLSRWAFVDVLDYAGRFTILVTVVAFFVNAAQEAANRQQELVRQTEQQRKTKHYQAWQMLNSAAGKPGNAGRNQALSDLYADGVSFERIDLEGAVLNGIRLDTNGPVDFQYANLSAAQFGDARLTRANFRMADLSLAVLSTASCARADFEKANLDHARLDGTDLMGANFKSARLTNATLAGARLDGANLTHARLAHANLTGAILTNANLTSACLSNAVFRNADLRGANLSSVDNWKQIKSMKDANIRGVRHPPKDFIEWAKDKGAIDKP